MRVTVPITVTDAMLVSSTLVEAPPAMHAMDTTYALGATASTGVVGGLITVWKSLQAANAGHAPATSPTWWQNIGTTYSVYDPTRTYALNDRVIDPVAHLVYESRIDGPNLNQPLATGTAWLDLKMPTNKWAAFDDLRNTQAEAPVDIVQEIQLTDRANTIAVIGLDARTITIKQTVGGVEKYSVTANLSKRKSRGWKAWYFGSFESRTSVQYYDLPPYRNSRISVTVSKPAAGRRAVGGIIIGNAVYIGDAQYEATSDHLNFSNVERDKFGNLSLDPERSVPKVDLQVWFDKSLTSQIMKLREQLNGRPAIWSGLDDFTLDWFEPLFIFGIHKEFSLNLKGFDYGVITLQVEEM
ncbi:hypothetical protein GTP44_03770 [Duganella sp. FT50W]|uniref:Uncharacterized protein n=1 Tax=Duganella lactea TaxID=2692173 RepID=A0A6L8MNX0_9BURK|nr:hypothetical protein [Duganella lactea]MYM81078.1 hypothetical protein [Duganella lactea]